MSIAELLATQMTLTRKWTKSLVGDFSGDEWTFQPREGMAHALWLCGHIAVSQYSLIFVRCLGGTALEAGFRDHFAPGGDVPAAAVHEFPAAVEVLERMDTIHDQARAAVRGMSQALLAEPAFSRDGQTAHPLYQDKMGAVSHSIRHEAFHAGQIASIRRLLGKTFLR